jgi:hypothetical protein
MSDPMKQAEGGAADEFSTLGRMMKARYRARATMTRTRPPRSVGSRMRMPPSARRSGGANASTEYRGARGTGRW